MSVRTINPYYIIKDGIKILERSLLVLACLRRQRKWSAIYLVCRGEIIDRVGGKIQLFSVVGDYSWIYAIYGLLLALYRIPLFQIVSNAFCVVS